VTSTGHGVFFLTTSGSHRGDSPTAYRLQVDAAGRAGRLAPVPGDLLPPGCRLIAVSPGGTILAYTVPDMTPPPSTAQAGLVDLTTGERRIASLPAGSLRELSLSNDGQTLAFQWQPRSGGEVDAYVAATAATDWVTQGKVLTDPDGLPYDAIRPVISADGRSVYLTVAQPEPTGGPHWNRLLEAAADGGQPRVLFELRYQPGGGNVVYMWAPVCRDHAGEWLLAFADGYVYRIEISSGAVIRLPFPEGQPYDAAW
jgi:Tol biopolymer transport system component